MFFICFSYVLGGTGQGSGGNGSPKTLPNPNRFLLLTVRSPKASLVGEKHVDRKPYSHFLEQKIRLMAQHFLEDLWVELESTFLIFWVS